MLWQAAAILSLVRIVLTSVFGNTPYTNTSLAGFCTSPPSSMSRGRRTPRAPSPPRWWVDPTTCALLGGLWGAGYRCHRTAKGGTWDLPVGLPTKMNNRPLDVDWEMNKLFMAQVYQMIGADLMRDPISRLTHDTLAPACINFFMGRS
jgi:hypothetical protein